MVDVFKLVTMLCHLSSTPIFVYLHYSACMPQSLNELSLSPYALNDRVKAPGITRELIAMRNTINGSHSVKIRSGMMAYAAVSVCWAGSWWWWLGVPLPSLISLTTNIRHSPWVREADSWPVVAFAVNRNCWSWRAWLRYESCWWLRAPNRYYSTGRPRRHCDVKALLLWWVEKDCVKD